jgi:ubiquinone/menaquinone biosynthesis C-methylase UbiE
MAEDIKAIVRAQFGDAAEAYAVSTIHAKGESLALLVEFIQPQPSWHMLDVGTGAGHTAIRFAPRVKDVVATDLTEAMVDKAAELAARQNLKNMKTKIADAENLPFDDAAFDLVTCRLALHHFPNSPRALQEFSRVLKPQGILGFTDNVTVDDLPAAKYYNEFEKLRDPSHQNVLSLKRLCQLIEEAGFYIRCTRVIAKEFEFHDWANRQHVQPQNKILLLQMMREIPEILQPLFKPQWTDTTLFFSLRETVIIALKIR